MQLIKVIVISIFKLVTCEFNTNNDYEGSYFPVKYLNSDEGRVSSDDLDNYLKYFTMSINFFGRYLNKTDVNTALAVFFSKSLLKRTLLDDESKLRKYQRDQIKENINVAENIISHYIYKNIIYDWDDLEFRVMKILQNDAPLVHTIGKFNRNRLNQWILNKEHINEFIEDFDKAILPKEKYVELVISTEQYVISIKDSDRCISHVAYNAEPIDLSQMRRCQRDLFCEKRMHSNPSVAYSLSHRLLNVYLRFHLRRCYISSEEEDKLLMDKLCANMYRETVYLARRGHFARDLFLEHIALCAMLGYEEFHRKHWFDKAISWITKEGCLVEYHNFNVNRTKIFLKRASDNFKLRQYYREVSCKLLNSECDDHPTAVALVVFGHAIRYAAHFMNVIKPPSLR